MNLLNRILLVLLCLALIAASVAVVVIAWAIPDDAIQWLVDAAVRLDEYNTTGTRVLITVAGIFVVLVALLLLLAELGSRAGDRVEVTGLQGGDAVLTTAAIGQRIEEAVNHLPHVTDVRATVRARRKGVLLGMDLHVDPDANLAAVTDAACDAAREVLAEKVHVALLKPPSVRLHYRELRLQNRQGRRPLPARPAPVAAENRPEFEAPESHAHEDTREGTEAAAYQPETSERYGPSDELERPPDEEPPPRDVDEEEEKATRT